VAMSSRSVTLGFRAMTVAAWCRQPTGRVTPIKDPAPDRLGCHRANQAQRGQSAGGWRQDPRFRTKLISAQCRAPPSRDTPCQRESDMKALSLPSERWRRFHGTAERTRAATFGTFDGATSSYGVTFAMFVQHQPTSAFVAPVIGLAIASAAGMGGGEAASGDRSDMSARVVVMALHSFFGVVAVALPFFYLTGAAALGISLVIAFGLGVVIAQRRARDLSRGRAYALTFGTLALAIGVTSIVALALPGSGG
jgi:hypothetical protein